MITRRSFFKVLGGMVGVVVAGPVTFKKVPRVVLFSPDKKSAKQYMDKMRISGLGTFATHAEGVPVDLRFREWRGMRGR